jgi:hypothetical protein
MSCWKHQDQLPIGCNTHPLCSVIICYSQMLTRPCKSRWLRVQDCFHAPTDAIIASFGTNNLFAMTYNFVSRPVINDNATLADLIRYAIRSIALALTNDRLKKVLSPQWTMTLKVWSWSCNSKLVQELLDPPGPLCTIIWKVAFQMRRVAQTDVPSDTFSDGQMSLTTFKSKVKKFDFVPTPKSEIRKKHGGLRDPDFLILQTRAFVEKILYQRCGEYRETICSKKWVKKKANNLSRLGELLNTLKVCQLFGPPIRHRRIGGS